MEARFSVFVQTGYALHKTATLNYIINCPLVTSYDMLLKHHPEEVVTDEIDLAQRFQTSVWNDERSTSTQGDERYVTKPVGNLNRLR